MSTPPVSLAAQRDRRGQVFGNPVTLERVVMLTDPDTHPEGVFVGHLYVRPTGRVAALHSHPTTTERFHVLHGQVSFRIDGKDRVLGPGEQARVTAGAVRDWWQVGAEEAQVLVEVAPGARFVEMVATTFGLARDSEVDRRGLPQPLQLAVTAAAYRDTLVFTIPPPWAQRMLFGVLAPLGRALGRRPAYPRCLTSTEVVDPVPAALGLLDDHGRLRVTGERTGPGSGSGP